MDTKRLWFRITGIAFIAILLYSCTQNSDMYTKGIGKYPGSPDENFSPDLVPDNDNYRNIARLRPAYQSSAFDYNLTAQLVTDGIISSIAPAYLELTSNEGSVPKNEKEWIFDHKPSTSKTFQGENVWINIVFGGDEVIPEVTSVEFTGELVYAAENAGGWEFRLLGSNDGSNWIEIDQADGRGLPGSEKKDPFMEMIKKMAKDPAGKPKDPYEDFFGPSDPGEPKPSFSFDLNPPQPTRLIAHTFNFDKPSVYKMYRAEFNTHGAKSLSISEFNFFRDEAPVEIVPSHKFNSAWMSAGTNQEWIYVDLGSRSRFDKIRLYWIEKPLSGTIQISDDAQTWSDLAQIPGAEEKTDEISLGKGVTGRYVRVLMNGTDTGKVYILSEIEIYGKGGLTAVPKTPPSVNGNRMYMSGGEWKVQRSSLVSADGNAISEAGFGCTDWVTATVPGTVLTSYLNAGAIPDPNFGDNQLLISESFFCSDFWYRNEFDVPADFTGNHLFLNFDGINWKSEVYVNGTRVGRIDGAFIRGIFDVTGLIRPGQKNAIAVLIIKNDNPGTVKEQTILSTDKNGGILGADNPTFHASVGWDWIPTIRGRNTGIWNDVFLSVTGDVKIENPFVYSEMNLPDTSSADINIEVTLRNMDDDSVRGTLKGRYGDNDFEGKIVLGPSELRLIRLNPETNPELRLPEPILWWPKGYGGQYLYNVELAFVTEDNRVSDRTEFKSGIRQMSYTEDNNILNIYINGRRFIARGGNWGFPESNLAYRDREYDIAVGYHADMNFTMIRNWVAQTADDEFFEACDRHGIMVWQDFCLANPADGPEPYDPAMFLKNAEDVVSRIRNHASIGIYVGRNEGNPPEVIDTGLRRIIASLHPGIHYIPNSASGVVSGGGPYRALPVKDYYLLYGRNKLHSERGMPNVMTFESLKQTLPESALWPQNSMWGMHDYTLESAQSAASFNELLEKGFGPAKDAQEFTELAQWINYNGYRGMFEGRSRYRQGLLLWMSHPAWPSMVWQTYDYFFEPTAAYFGCKKASEAIHIQWNPVFDDIEVVNLNGRNRTGLSAKAQLINMDGSVKWEKEKNIDSNEDTTEKLFKLEFPEDLSAVHFVKLTLKEEDRIISDNFYWRGVEEGNYQALRELPVTDLDNVTSIKRSGADWIITTTLTNSSSIPALMIRLKVTGRKSGERLLPVIYSDNYFSLMPGEEKVITMKLKNEDTQGEKPAVEITGFNL